MKLIDKSALVAEIERLREEEYPCDTFEESTGYYNALDEVSSFLNTLEMKEVDLNAAVERYVEQHKSELNGYFDIRRMLTKQTPLYL